MSNCTVKTITIPAGKVVRKYEQTASRDHDVTLIPGTYPVKVRNGYMISGSIPAIADPYTASTVEYGGVVLATETRGGEETFSLSIYDHEIPRYEANGYTFGF